MKLLVFPFERAGWRYELLERHGNVCLVKHIRLGLNFWDYEVIIVRVIPERLAFGYHFEAYEQYPISEAWGKYAWTYRPEELERALARMSQLQKGTLEAKLIRDSGGRLNDSLFDRGQQETETHTDAAQSHGAASPRR